MILFRVFILSLSIISIINISSCSSNNAPSRDTSTLSALRALSRGDAKSSGLTGLRYIAIRDTALSIGARGGLAHRAAQMNAELKQDRRYLERIFNFNALLLDDNVLPPILIEGRDTLEQNMSDTIRLSDRQYVILSQARFVTTVPHWREYLWMGYPKPELPDPSLLPKDDNEARVWDKYVSEGWESGLQQGNAIFQENLGRLKRDYEGMVRYRRLLAQHIVSAPFVARTEMGVTGGTDELAINDRILRITALPAFEADIAKWDPITSTMTDKKEDLAESSWGIGAPLPDIAPRIDINHQKNNNNKNKEACNININNKNINNKNIKNKLLTALNLAEDCPNEQ